MVGTRVQARFGNSYLVIVCTTMVPMVPLYIYNIEVARSVATSRREVDADLDKGEYNLP